MAEGDNILHGAVQELLRPACQGGGDVIDASHRGNDPDFIANTCPAVLPGKAREGVRSMLFQVGMGWRIRVSQCIGKVRPDIVGVQPAPGRHLHGGVANGAAVFDDLVSRVQGSEGNLVTGRHILPQRNPCHRFTGVQVRERHGHVV